MYGTGTGTAMTPGTRSSKSWGSRHRCVLSPSLRYVFFFLYSFINLLTIYFLIDCMYTTNTTTSTTITFSTSHPNDPATAGRARDASVSRATGMYFFVSTLLTNIYIDSDGAYGHHHWHTQLPNDEQAPIYM